MGRFARIDGRKSLNYSKAVIIVVVVSCLIGTLITISALVDSAKNFEISDSLTSNVKMLELSKNKTYVVEDDSSYLLKKSLKDNVKHTGGMVEASSDVTKEEVPEIKGDANFQSLEAVSVSVDDGMAAVESLTNSVSNNVKRYRWKLCNVTAGPDYIPCLDNIQAIRKLPSTSHYEHCERHCPDHAPTCLVSLPEGYRSSVPWPKSRERIWFANVPHVTLVEFKGHQNWVQLSGTYITFPGGGTQFKNGATHYIDFIQKTVPAISWGKKSRVILDVRCGVASFGGYLFDREVLTMSLAPKDKHEAQVQFALERGIPTVSAVLGTKKLPFPSMAFDVVHCARCRVPWHIEDFRR